MAIVPPAKLEAMLTRGDPHLAISELSVMRRSPVATCGVQLQWAAQKDSTIDQSEAVPLVLFEGPCAWQDDILNTLRRGGHEWRVTFESSSLDALLAATKSGLGIAALPAEVIRRSRLAHLKSASLPPAPTIEFGLFQATALPKRAQTLLEVIRTSTFMTQSTRPGSRPIDSVVRVDNARSIRVARILKPVSDPGLGQDVLGLDRVIFDFLAQHLHVSAQILGSSPYSGPQTVRSIEEAPEIGGWRSL